MAAMRPTQRRTRKRKPAPSAPAFTVADFYRWHLTHSHQPGGAPTVAEYRRFAGLDYRLQAIPSPSRSNAGL